MIRLLFSRQPTIWSYAIRQFQQSPFSHVALLLPGGTYQARFWSGVTLEPTIATLLNTSQHSTGHAIATVPADPAKVEEFCRWQLRKPYDWRAVLGIGFRRDWRDDRAWFCSELAAAALEHAGVHPVAKDASRVTPDDLLRSPVLTIVKGEI